MDKAKIRLSAKEAELVANADWILTKNHILQKVKSILEGLQLQQQQFLKSHHSLLPALFQTGLGVQQRVPPNPSIEGTSSSGLRPLPAAPHVKR